MPKSSVIYENDIGNYIGTKPSDRILANLLENHWEPPSGYKYPNSSHIKNGRTENRQLKKDHLEKYKSWLVLSHLKQGLFCKFCPFFATGHVHVGGHHGGMKLNTLVNQPLTKFAKLLGKDGDLEHLSKLLYHQQAMGKANDFLLTYHNPEKSVENQVDSYRLQRAKVNQERLSSSLDNVLFLGRQNIPFRARRDDGFENNPLKNQGNFKELMKFRIEVCKDAQIQKQCDSIRHRNSFLSKTVQNDLIECCGEEILSLVLRRIEENKVYSIGFDETTDVSHKTQLSIFLRYVCKNCIREDFVGFIDPRNDSGNLWENKTKPQNHVVSEETLSSFSSNSESEEEPVESEDPRLTGDKLGKLVLECLHGMNLDPSYCIGIATDGCSVMTSELVGAIKTIKDQCVFAERTPCLNHSLNLSISSCSNVQAVRNAIGIIKETVSFFTASPKRNNAFLKNVGRQLISMCETRWVERHLSVAVFLENFNKIVLTLEKISNWAVFMSDKSSAMAKTLLCSITHGEFIITLVCLADILSQTLPLSRYFQKENVDVYKASEFLSDVLFVLEDKRQNAETGFHELFEQATEIAKSVNSELKVPRTTSRQVNRANAATSDVKSYFRVNLYIPILDSIVTDMKSRFSAGALELYRLNILLPKECINDTVTKKRLNADIELISKKYGKTMEKDDSAFKSDLKAEMNIWMAKWKRENYNKTPLPSSAIECLGYCVAEMFPTIKHLLVILASLPVSVATAERSFSTLKITKTWLRNRCGQKRLTGLALMYIHKDIVIEKTKVINRYIEKGGKRRKEMFS